MLLCEFIYDKEKSGVLWADMADDWVCPACESPKKYYRIKEDTASGAAQDAGIIAESDGPGEDIIRTSDQIETYMADIHRMAETGPSISEPMRN